MFIEKEILEMYVRKYVWMNIRMYVCIKVWHNLRLITCGKSFIIIRAYVGHRELAPPLV